MSGKRPSNRCQACKHNWLRVNPPTPVCRPSIVNQHQSLARTTQSACATHPHSGLPRSSSQRTHCPATVCIHAAETAAQKGEPGKAGATGLAESTRTYYPQATASATSDCHVRTLVLVSTLTSSGCTLMDSLPATSSPAGQVAVQAHTIEQAGSSLRWLDHQAHASLATCT